MTPTTSHTDLLEIRHVSRAFHEGLFQKKEIFRDVTFKIPPGKITGLFGVNGAGKTTLIRIILGLLHPTTGAVFYGNKPILAKHRKTIGYVPEKDYFCRTLTVEESLHFQLKLMQGKLSHQERTFRIEEILTKLHIRNLKSSCVKNLSKGQGRKLAWAFAVIHKPHLLILDEPFSGLDSSSKKEMQRFIEEEASRGTAILLCTHGLRYQEALCDQFFVLEQGSAFFPSRDSVSLDSSRYGALSSGMKIQGEIRSSRLRDLRTIVQRTFLNLRRDRVFFPSILMMLGFFLLSYVMTSWVVSEFEKILFDVGLFSFHILGSLVALFWGTKLMEDVKNQRYWDIEIGCGVSRKIWLLGSYLGLAWTLILMGCCLIATWQIFMLLSGFGWMSIRALEVMGFHVFGWCVVAAVAQFFGTFMRQGIALFSSLSLWLFGLSVRYVGESLPEDINPVSSVLIKAGQLMFDLQAFHISLEASSIIDPWLVLSYGGCLMVCIMSSMCLFFERKDLI